MTLFASRILALLACGQSHIDTLVSNIVTLSGRDILTTSCIIGGFWLMHQQNAKIVQLSTQLTVQNSATTTLASRLAETENQLRNQQSNITLLNDSVVRISQESRKNSDNISGLIESSPLITQQLENHTRLFKELFARLPAPAEKKGPEPQHQIVQSQVPSMPPRHFGMSSFFSGQQTNIFNVNNGIGLVDRPSFPSPWFLKKT